MSFTTPRRSSRIPHTHTPKMSERKKGLFQRDSVELKDSLQKHRRLPVLDSESDSEDIDLGIISTIDTSSSDEMGEREPKTPERDCWYETRSHTTKLFKESQALKNFMKSPFTLNKFQSRYSNSEPNSSSTPATPHFHNNPETPSSSHSCTSAHTSSSEHSRARKSLASLIADTESCSSSLKDLTFDSDSGTDSKENTPTKQGVRRSLRKKTLTPKYYSFKGILLEQKKNSGSPGLKCLTRFDKSDVISPSEQMKTPQNSTTIDVSMSPPKINNRRSMIEIAESPEESSDNEKSNKRLRNDSIYEGAPSAKYLKLDPSVAPKARLSLFNSDKLKEILSTKSFYGKTNPEMTKNVTRKIETAVQTTINHPRKQFHHTSYRRRSRKPGQINMGVRHKIRKPKMLKGNIVRLNAIPEKAAPIATNKSLLSNKSFNSSVLSQNSTHIDIENDKVDPFASENLSIAALLSQWDEEEIPDTDSRTTNHMKSNDLVCFNKSVMDECNPILPPVSAVPVESSADDKPIGDSDAIIEELGATGDHSMEHGALGAGLLPVDGGYIAVNNNSNCGQDELLDLDKIEKELKMLDEQILQIAHSNNMNAEAVIASVDAPDISIVNKSGSGDSKANAPVKLFPIFDKPLTGLPTTPSSSRATGKAVRPNLKKLNNQYIIDAGQKKFGATRCTECGVIYEIGDPQDEYDHLMYHNATDVLRYNGLKEELVVGRYDSGRVVQVRGGSRESGWKRVLMLLERLVHPQLGYTQPLRDHRIYTAYLYIEKKQIVGCLLAEPRSKANKLIPGNPDCCSDEEYPVRCGISRIWTHRLHRRSGVARRLLDCARTSFLYGELLLPHQLAFSAPTDNGKALATGYCQTKEFYVYLD